MELLKTPNTEKVVHYVSAVCDTEKLASQVTFLSVPAKQSGEILWITARNREKKKRKREKTKLNKNKRYRNRN
jgi:hypothetical protein